MVNELYHYGIKGQKWGVRRYQNEDGSLTTAGRQRYGVGEAIKNVGRKLFGPNKVDLAIRNDERQTREAEQELRVSRKEDKRIRKEAIAKAKGEARDSFEKAKAAATDQYVKSRDKAAEKYASKLEKTANNYKDVTGKDLAKYAIAKLGPATVATVGGGMLAIHGKSQVAKLAGLSLTALGAAGLSVSGEKVGTAIGGRIGYNISHPKKR